MIAFGLGNGIDGRSLDPVYDGDSRRCIHYYAVVDTDGT